MKKQVIKFWDKIIVVLLGIAGVLGSCDKPKPEYGMAIPEYGTPYVMYELKGIVSDKETSNPIPNIQIIRNNWDTLYTDTDGKYTVKQFAYGYGMRYSLKFEDIDGEENGGDFETQEVEVKFTQADQVEKGKFAKTQNIALEKKK